MLRDLQGVEIKGDRAAVHVSGPKGKIADPALIVILKQIDGVWRLADIQEAKGPLAKNLAMSAQRLMQLRFEIIRARAIRTREEAIAKQSPNKSSVGIYLITARPKDVDLGKVPLADFTLADKPLISEADILEYDWESHTIRLKQQAVADRIFGLKGIGDTDAFVVVANGQRLYAGVMMSDISSYLPRAPVIYVGIKGLHPKKAIRIDLLPKAGRPDPRNDGRLKQALQALHLLSRPDPTSSARQPATRPQAFFPIVTKTLRFAPNDLRDSAISFGRARLISPSNDLNRDDKQRSDLGVDAWLDNHGLSGQLRLRWTHMRVFEAPDAAFEAATPNDLRKLVDTSGGREKAAYLFPIESTGKTFAFVTETRQMGLLQIDKTGVIEGRNEVVLRYKLLRRGADAGKIIATATPVDAGRPEAWRWRVTSTVPVRVIEGFVIDGGKGHVYSEGGSPFRGGDVEIEVSVLRKDGEIKVVRSIGNLSAGQKATIAYPVKLPENTPLTVRHVSPAVRLTTTGLMKLWEGEFRNGNGPPRTVAYAARIETWDVPPGEGVPFRLNDEVPSRPSTTRPAGSKLEFRVAPKPSDLTGAELASYMDWLKAGKIGFWWKDGRIAGRMPDHAWLPIASELTNAQQLVTGEHDGRKYVLVSDKPGQTMVPGKGNDAWSLAKVYAAKDSLGQPAIGFELDARGAELFGALTKANVNSALAMIVDGKVIAAPVLKTALGKQAIITGRFTEQEVAALVRTLRAEAAAPGRWSPSAPKAADERWDQEMIKEAAAWMPLLAEYCVADFAKTWPERRKALETIVSQHPNSQWVDDAQIALACGMVAFENDVAGAIALLDDIIADYPDASTIVVWFWPGRGYEFDGLWIEARGGLVVLNDDGTVRWTRPFDKHGKIGEDRKEFLAYFEHLKHHPRKTTVVAKLFQAGILCDAGQDDLAVGILDGIIADARKTIAATAAADRQAAQGPYGWYILRLWRPEYMAWHARARLLAKTDPQKSTELITELARIVSPDGWHWQLNNVAGALARQNKQEATAIEQYRLAARGLQSAIGKDENRTVDRLPPAEGSPTTLTPLEQELAIVQRKIAQ